MFKKSGWKITIVIITAILAIFFIFAAVSDEGDKNPVSRVLSIFAVKTPEVIDFAGEAPPTDLFYVKEQLDREITVNTFWHSSTIMMFKKANRYFPVIETILAEYNIPDDFKYLALIESGLTNVVSPSGAAGFWQFLEGTAKEYGLTVNKEVDERYNLEMATRAACLYLRLAFDKYNSWTMAAASYNAGMNRMDAIIEKQKSLNYYDLSFNEETARYIYRVLAVKEIMKHPEKYGYHFEEDDLYQPVPTRVVTVDTTVHDLGSFALQQGINYKLLKEFNPWLIDNKLTVTEDRKFYIKIPVFKEKKG